MEWRAEFLRKSERRLRLQRLDPQALSGAFIKATEKLWRKATVILIQLRTGHSVLNARLHRIECSDSPTSPTMQ